MNGKKLNEVGLSNVRLAEDASWALYGGWDLAEIVEVEADRLKYQVRSGEISINELRAGVIWANALDKEAVESHGADLTHGDQRKERTVRRLMHSAGRSALEDLKNKRRRIIAQVACKQAQNLVQ